MALQEVGEDRSAVLRRAATDPEVEDLDRGSGQDRAE
jgi:hypothetical protein